MREFLRANFAQSGAVSPTFEAPIFEGGKVGGRADFKAPALRPAAEPRGAFVDDSKLICISKILGL